MASTEDRDRLLATIDAAFEGVSRLGGISLREADAIDDYEDDKGLAAARALDLKEEWPDGDRDGYIASHPSVLCFLDPIGLRYYLPAYMKWALLHPDTDSSSPDAVLAIICRLPDRVFGDPERLAAFNDRQRNALAQYLQYWAKLLNDPDLPKALKDYWAKHL